MLQRIEPNMGMKKVEELEVVDLEWEGIPSRPCEVKNETRGRLRSIVLERLAKRSRKDSKEEDR